MEDNRMKMVPLYGGAMETSLPSTAIDVSQFRQIPDTQEVFILEMDTKEKDQNIIIDLLEMVDKPYNDAILEHIEDARDKVMPNFIVEEVQNPHLSCKVYISFVLADNLLTLLSLLRLEKTETDILISMNIPVGPEFENIDIDDLKKCLCHGENTDIEGSFESNDLNSYINNLQKSYGIFRRASLTLKINDWGLFGL